MNGTLRSTKTSSTVIPKSAVKRATSNPPKRSLSSSNVKQSVNENSGISTKPKLSKKTQENKENGVSLLTRVTNLESKFEELKKSVESLVFLDNIVKELMPAFQSLKDEVTIIKENMKPVEESNIYVDPDVEALSSILSCEDKIKFDVDRSSDTIAHPPQPSVQIKDTNNTPIKNSDDKDHSKISRTPKLGDFDISATTLANLPKSNRHKSLSSVMTILKEAKDLDHHSQSQNSPNSHSEEKNEGHERQSEIVFKNVDTKITRKRRKDPRKSEDCVSMFPQMKLVVEEELAPIRFLLGVVDINRLNNVIEKMNEYVADQGFDHGIYIKSIKLEDVSSKCKISDKHAKLVTHILCKLMRLEMKSENEFKILSGTTIQTM